MLAAPWPTALDLLNSATANIRVDRNLAEEHPPECSPNPTEECWEGSRGVTHEHERKSSWHGSAGYACRLPHVGAGRGRRGAVAVRSGGRGGVGAFGAAQGQGRWPASPRRGEGPRGPAPLQ